MASPQLPSAPSTSVTATSTSEPSTEPPPLTTSHNPNSEELTNGLKLIADSVAQQRQYASRAVIFNPLVLGVYVLGLSMLWSYMVAGHGNDKLPVYFTTSAGITMAFLVGVRKVVAGYIVEAEQMGVSWLVDEDKEGPAGKKGRIDEVVVTKFGDEVIGVAVWRILGDPAPAAGGNSKKKSARGCKDGCQSGSQRLDRPAQVQA